MEKYSDLAALQEQSLKSIEALERQAPPETARVRCDHCLGDIAACYYHCGSCTSDDFDLCAARVQNGVHRYQDMHILMKRTSDYR